MRTPALGAPPGEVLGSRLEPPRGGARRGAGGRRGGSWGAPPLGGGFGEVRPFVGEGAVWAYKASRGGPSQGRRRSRRALSWRPLSVGFTMSFSAALATSLKSSVCVGLGKPRTAPADFSAGAHAALQSGHQRRWMCSRQSGLLFSSGKLKRIGHWSSPLRVTRRKTDPRCL